MLCVNTHSPLFDRTITALWRAKTASPEKKAFITEEQGNQESVFGPGENDSSLFPADDANNLKIYSTTLPFDVSGCYDFLWFRLYTF